jgi:N-acetylmuramoyl-L-alanine amidase
VLVALGTPGALSATTLVGPVRAQSTADGVRVTLDLSGPAEHTVFTLDGPDRVVVDLRQARLAQRLDPIAEVRPLIGVRAGNRGADLRVVLDVREPVRPRTFLVKTDGAVAHRLVVEIEPAGGRVARPASPAPPASEPALRDVVVAIDAGHGGVDPGATGPSGVHEKHVVLAIARQVHALLKRERGIRPVMTRTGDQFLSLRRRTAVARSHRADLFVSIHADANEDRRLRGSSVYALSPGGASSEAARWLAERENAADLAGGVTLDDKDDLLAAVLLDLSQTATIESSLGVGRRVLRELSRVGEAHKSTVQQAGFVVLKSPDIPSILVETAFISNPEDEQRLTGASHQKAVAGAIAAGIRGYFVDHAPPGTLLAARSHVIARGESVSTVAARYHVSPDALRAKNGLQGETLPPGKVLAIPNEGGS